MKQTTRKFILFAFAMMFLATLAFTAPVQADEGVMKVTVRIEGITGNIFYATEEIPYTDSLTVQQALSYLDEQNDGLSITGIDTAYITDINGDAGGSFGGWDGWLYTVNGIEAMTGIDGAILEDGDSVLLYYGDPYGVGMQYPVADLSQIDKGVIRFTSSDTTYDDSFNPTTTVNPVADAVITWSYGTESAAYVTDNNGEIVIAKEQLTDGKHSLQIAKVNDAGIPLVLRFAPDYTVSVKADSKSQDTAATGNSDAKTENTQKNTSTPKTGEAFQWKYVILGLSAISLCGTIILKKKEIYEN